MCQASSPEPIIPQEFNQFFHPVPNLEISFEQQIEETLVNSYNNIKNTTRQHIESIFEKRDRLKYKHFIEKYYFYRKIVKTTKLLRVEITGDAFDPSTNNCLKELYNTAIREGREEAIKKKFTDEGMSRFTIYIITSSDAELAITSLFISVIIFTVWCVTAISIKRLLLDRH